MKKPLVSPGEIYDVEETCRALGVSRKSLRRYTAAGVITSHIRRADNRIVYLGEDILKCYYSVI